MLLPQKMDYPCRDRLPRLAKIIRSTAGQCKQEMLVLFISLRNSARERVKNLSQLTILHDSKTQRVFDSVCF